MKTGVFVALRLKMRMVVILQFEMKVFVAFRKVFVTLPESVMNLVIMQQIELDTVLVTLHQMIRKVFVALPELVTVSVTLHPIELVMDSRSLQMKDTVEKELIKDTMINFRGETIKWKKMMIV